MIGEMPAFPIIVERSLSGPLGPVSVESFPGMTYRQWLIGQALMGCSAIPSLEPEPTARIAIEIADRALAKLEAEQKGKP